MARRYGSTFWSLAWPFPFCAAVWFAPVAAGLILRSPVPNPYSGDFPSLLEFVFLPALLAATLVSLVYAWGAIRSQAKPLVRYSAFLLNLVPVAAFLFSVLR
jgi:hypothetical protein